MTAFTVHYSAFQRLRHSSFEITKGEPCKAIVQIKSQGIRVIIFADETREILAFDDIQFTKAIHTTEQIAQFQYFMSESGLSQLNIDKIWFCYAAPHFCLLPEVLFDEEKAYLALNQVCEVDYPHLIKSQKISNGARIIYALPKEWEDWTTQLFVHSEITWNCNQTGLLESGFATSKDSGDGICLAQIENDHLLVSVFTSNKLLFFNRFDYHSENDLLYFCLLTMSENGLEPYSTRFILSGSILPGSMGMEKLNRYFGAIEFSKTVHTLHIEPRFEALRHHNYFDLISQMAYIQQL